MTAIPIWNETTKRWRYYPMYNGVRKAFYSSKPSKRFGPAECRRKESEWIESGQKKNRRLRDCWPEYINDVKHRGGLINLAQRESHGRTYLLPSLGHKLVGKISPQDWQDLINAASDRGVSGRPLSKKSLKNIRGTITDFCKWSKQAKLINDAPVLYVPKFAQKSQHVIIQPQNLAKLFEPAEQWYLNAWRLMVVTGMRPGEVFGLHREDAINGQLSIVRSVNPLGEITDGKTLSAHRTQTQHAFIRKILAAQVAQLNSCGIVSAWLFPGRSGDVTAYSASYSAWQRYGASRGIDSTLYELRHTFISLMKNHLPQDMLQRTVGHTPSMDTIGVYGHDVDGEMDEAAALIEERLITLFDHTPYFHADILEIQKAREALKTGNPGMENTP